MAQSFTIAGIAFMSHPPVEAIYAVALLGSTPLGGPLGSQVILRRLWPGSDLQPRCLRHAERPR